MHTRLITAVDADSWTVDFGESVDIVEFDSQFIPDSLTHLLSPAFGTDHAFLQADLILDSALFNLFCKEQGIRRSRADYGALHIRHHL